MKHSFLVSAHAANTQLALHKRILSCRYLEHRSLLGGKGETREGGKITAR